MTLLEATKAVADEAAATLGHTDSYVSVTADCSRYRDGSVKLSYRVYVSHDINNLDMHNVAQSPILALAVAQAIATIRAGVHPATIDDIEGESVDVPCRHCGLTLPPNADSDVCSGCILQDAVLRPVAES